jgi:hypothetical protein
MTNVEKFCLRWNEFENNISTAFRELRDDKDFFDVSIACDGSQLQAHKAILSACSPFFRSILKKNPHQHPLLYLKGVKHEDILSRPTKQPSIRTSYEHAMAGASGTYEKKAEYIAVSIKTEAQWLT